MNSDRLLDLRNHFKSVKPYCHKEPFPYAYNNHENNHAHEKQCQS